jgi:hypothetical protein
MSFYERRDLIITSRDSLPKPSTPRHSTRQSAASLQSPRGSPKLRHVGKIQITL